jgi:hypothetical protein
LAVVLFVLGVVLQTRGLQDAANVAQLLSILLAMPPLIASSVRLYSRRREIGEPQAKGTSRGNAMDDPGDVISKGNAAVGPIRVSAEVAGVEQVGRVDGHMFPTSGHRLRLYVESAGGTLILRQLRVVIVSREDIHGELIDKPTAGIMEPRKLDLDLSATSPRVVARPGYPDFPFSVGKGDPEVLEITVYLESGKVSWHLLLDWTFRGELATYRIDAAGHPFVTVGWNSLSGHRRSVSEGG